MEIRLIFLNLRVSDGVFYFVVPYWIGAATWLLPGNSPLVKGRTKTDTGGWVEYTKALEITILKELGKLHP
jgi:hypothetical protein